MSRDASRYRSLKVTGLATSIPAALVAGPILGYLIGSWCGRRFHTGIWLTALLCALGFAGGVRNAVRILKEIEAIQSEEDREKR